MFGPDLLVAPIFSEDGEVTYYVPKGKWVGLLDKKERIGPAWFTETYDFFSLPLLIREGAVIILSKEPKAPDYDLFSKGFEVIACSPPQETVVVVPQGKSKLSVTFRDGKAWARTERGDMISGQVTIL